VSTDAGQRSDPTPIKKGTAIMTRTTDEVIDLQPGVPGSSRTPEAAGYSKTAPVVAALES
jgi:hypothetical protein